MKIVLRSFVCVVLFLSTGCSIYRIDVHQGNTLSSEQRQKLTIGLTKAQVQEIAGTPVLTPFFNKDRWDYYHALTVGSGSETDYKSHDVLFFEDNKLVRIEQR